MNFITIPCPFCQKRIPIHSSHCPECKSELPADFGEPERRKVFLFALVLASLMIVGIGAFLFYMVIQLLAR